MSKRDLLLEIGLEEMPARFMHASMVQLGEKLEAFLQVKKIAYREVKLFNSPRRLAVLVKDVAEKQEDIKEEAKGPAKKIAMDEDGNWTKAAIGFARGQGAAVEDLYVKDIKGTEYIHVQKFEKGKETFQQLTALRDVITDLHFPKNMRWGSLDLRYVRPIKWVVALFGEEIIEFDVIPTVKSGNRSEGHRFLGEQTVIDTAHHYEQKLEEQFVIADPEKRKEMILTQLKEIEAEQGWVIPIDESLLDEVNHLVEYPTALFGTYAEEFLELPEEVLITTMKEHQRYFPVKSKSGELLSKFITVRNGNKTSIDQVARGNEKVLRARLSDAAFFYKEDQKLNIDRNVQKLEKIVFHEELGTLADKVKRVIHISEKITELLNSDEHTKVFVRRAAQISKFDLVTQMIYEFPELQGIMGEKYARMLGEEEAVAQAVNEHYMPRFAGDDVPPSTIGAIVALADKLDTVASFFKIGVIPTGSQDPYALRRQASGIVHILLEKNWGISLDRLLALADAAEHKELHDFFVLRLKYILNAENLRHDVIDAVLDSEFLEPFSVLNKAKVLEKSLTEPTFKETVEALARVISISKKATTDTIVPSHFENEYETALYEAYLNCKEKVETSLKEQDYEQVIQQLAALQEPIEKYFNHTMVIAEDPILKENRLAQMLQLANLIKFFANMNILIVK